MNGFDFIVSTMAGFPDLALLHAAARSGAIAVLNLEAIDSASAEGLVAEFIRGKAGRIGIRLNTAADVDALPADALQSFDVVIMRADLADERPDTVSAAQSRRCRVLLECCTFDEADAGTDLRVDGLIAKGHEAGGRVGDETMFVLVQRLLAVRAMPVFAHGGIGIHTAPACFAAGCAGVVLDAQLLLARESSLPASIKRAVERMTGDETICVGGELGESYRLYRRPGAPALAELQRLEAELRAADVPERERRVWMAYGANTTYVHYTLQRASRPVDLEITPLITHRDFHTLAGDWRDPPPGDYRGTTGTRAVRSAVRLRVGTAGSGSLERHREVTVEAQDLDNLVPGTMVAITFEALAL